MIAAAALAVLAPRAAMAQAPRVRTALDTTLVSVGDRLQLTVTVEHTPGGSVVWPDSLSLEPFEILGAELLAPTEIEGRAVTGVRLTLTIFELGDLEIPSFDFNVQGPDGSATLVSSDPYGVTVQSVGLDEGGDIRAIRGPLGIPIGVIYVLPWLLLLVALGLLAFWLWRRRRGGDDSATRRSVIIPRLPHEEAYEALDRLEASDLLQRAEIKEYHIRVSEIIRTYVEGRFDVFALEMTTGEVMEGLRETGLDDDVLAAFDGFLSRCDLVKFAKLRPAPDASRRVLDTARELVDRTRPWVEDLTGAATLGGHDEDGDLDENGGQDEGGGGSPNGADDPHGAGESVLETAGAEGA
jgi:hypothetical protein